MKKVIIEAKDLFNVKFSKLALPKDTLLCILHGENDSPTFELLEEIRNFAGKLEFRKVDSENITPYKMFLLGIMCGSMGKADEVYLMEEEASELTKTIVSYGYNCKSITSLNQINAKRATKQRVAKEKKEEIKESFMNKPIETESEEVVTTGKKKSSNRKLLNSLKKIKDDFPFEDYVEGIEEVLFTIDSEIPFRFYF